MLLQVPAGQRNSRSIMPLQVQKTTEYVQEDGLPTEEECNAPPIDSSLTESVQVAEITRSATEM